MTLRQGDTLLRPWLQTDLAFLLRIRNDVPLQSQLLARVRGSDERQVLRWLYDRTAKPGQLFFIIADATSKLPIGFVQATDIAGSDRRGELGIGLVSEARSLGHGRRALQLVLDHLARLHELRKVWLRVRSDNHYAIRFYEQAGFQRCGILHSHTLIEGVWHDVILMERFLIIP